MLLGDQSKGPAQSRPRFRVGGQDACLRMGTGEFLDGPRNDWPHPVPGARDLANHHQNFRCQAGDEDGQTGAELGITTSQAGELERRALTTLARTPELAALRPAA